MRAVATGLEVVRLLVLTESIMGVLEETKGREGDSEVKGGLSELTLGIGTADAAGGMPEEHTPHANAHGTIDSLHGSPFNHACCV